MGTFIVVTQFDEIGPRNISRGNCSTNRGADAVEVSDGFIFGSLRNEVTTFEPTTIEFIDHKTLKGIRNWVYFVDPAKPRNHVRHRNHESRVDHQRQNEDGSWS